MNRETLNGIRLKDFVLNYSRKQDLGLPGEAHTRLLEPWIVTFHVPDESGVDGDAVGHASMFILRTTESGRSLLDILDEYSQDLYEIGVATIDAEGNYLRDDIGLVGFGDLLIVDRLQLSPALRGRGFGMALAAAAIDGLSRGCSAAACIPSPTEGEREGPQHAAAVMALRNAWAGLGFRHVDDNVWIADLCHASWGTPFRSLFPDL